MDTSRKLLWLAATAVGVIGLIIWSLAEFGWRDPVFALLVNWLAMSWVALAGQAVAIVLPSSFYEFRAWEGAGLIYERLGIRLFKKLVRRGPLAVFSPTMRMPKERTVPALQALDQQMRRAEAGHALIFLLMLVPAGYAVLRQWPDAVAWLLLFNVLINGYPIMLQRYNRIRLSELIARQSGLSQRLVQGAYRPSP